MDKGQNRVGIRCWIKEVQSGVKESGGRVVRVGGIEKHGGNGGGELI